MPSAREYDHNGYITIANNPITRVGVFPYLAKNVDKDMPPDQMVYVYRPAEELGSPETIKSMEMLPMIDDHAMLGPSELGYMPAEKKGVHGATGEDIAFKDNILYSNIKIFSETLVNLIDEGKVDLSLGYRCRYEKTPGIFGGQAYDYVQRSIKGNHLALVENGRCNVAVLDGSDTQLTFDHLDLNIKPKEKKEMKPEEIQARFDAQDAAISKLTEENKGLRVALDAMEEKKDDDKKAEDAEEDKDKDDKKDKDTKDEDDKEKDKKKDEAMDAMNTEISTLRTQVVDLQKNGIKSLMGQISQRDALAAKLSQHVGTFDHADKTLDEVAVYGVDKLGLECPKGTEISALNGFFKGRAATVSAVTGFATDSKDKSGGKLDAFINQKS